jgi:hypothetical protein
MENFYFSCIYDLLQGAATHADMHSQLNSLKVKLVNLQHRKLQMILLDTNQADRINSETPSLYNVLQMMRREERTITALQDDGGDIQTTPGGIARAMTSYLKNKYDTIPVERASIQWLLGILQTSRNEDNMHFITQPFEEAEIQETTQARRRRTAPGFDGIRLD